MTVAIPRSAMTKVAAGMKAQVDRANERNQRNDELYSQVVATFQARQQWRSGERVDVLSGQLRGQPGGLYLSNESGLIRLYVWRGDGKSRYTSKPVTVGILNPAQGWQVSAQFDSDAFHAWRKIAAAEMDRLG